MKAKLSIIVSVILFSASGLYAVPVDIIFTSDGVITLDSATNYDLVDTADTYGKFCIFQNGTDIRIKNRLGSEKEIKFTINY